MQFFARSILKFFSQGYAVAQAPNYRHLWLLPLFLLTASTFGQDPQVPTTPAAPPTQQTIPPPEPTSVTTPAIPPQAPAMNASTGAASEASSATSAEVTEEELRRELVGKPLFLRGGYLGDSLSFTEHGDPAGHPTIGAYTLSGVEIVKVRLTKHRVELEGARYALHFLGALPNEDSSNAVDRVKITPKKKVLKISIDREQLVKPRKVKEEKNKLSKRNKRSVPASQINQDAGVVPDLATKQDAAAAPNPYAGEPRDGATTAANQSADLKSVTTTTSPAHANMLLRGALDRVFAKGMDDTVRAQMPQFWQLYFRAQAAGVDYRPSDPKVFRPNAVDQQAKVTSSIAPDSNEYAQANAIAGRALYRAVVGADGKPGEIAVVRPIGFGLDEKAVEAILRASFQPALKNGQPVAETLDLAVMFRIYSKRTSGTAVAISDAKSTSEPTKPGPYSVKQP